MHGLAGVVNHGLDFPDEVGVVLLGHQVGVMRLHIRHAVLYPTLISRSIALADTPQRACASLRGRSRLWLYREPILRSYTPDRTLWASAPKCMPKLRS
jgi:hypothetical protein